MIKRFDTGNCKIINVAPNLITAVHMTALGFTRETSAALTEDVACHLRNGQVVYRIFADSHEAGFAIFATYEDVLYLSGIILMPAYQGRGVAASVIREVSLLYPECSYLVLRTQSLRMYLTATRLCKEFYPELGVQTLIPQTFSSRGSLVAGIINSDFPVHQGCYGGPLYGEKPVHSDSSLQILWDELCDFERGDAVLFVGALH